MTTTPLYRLFITIGGTDDAGDPDTDALIASTLGVPSLPYTSNDTDAKTLLPSGWHWGLDDQENIFAVRDSDGSSISLPAWDDEQNPVALPDAIAHCITAVQARLIDSDFMS